MLLNGHGGNRAAIGMVAHDVSLVHPVQMAAASYWEIARQAAAELTGGDEPAVFMELRNRADQLWKMDQTNTRAKVMVAVVAVQQVNQVALCPIDAGFKIAETAYIYWLPEVEHSAGAHRGYHGSHIIVGAGIIHHLYLHYGRPRVLRQHT